MNTKIDLKSASLGLVMGILCGFAMGAMPTTLPGQIGRFQIAGTGNHGLLLDTATGQVWTGFFSSSGGKTDGDFFQSKIAEKK